MHKGQVACTTGTSIELCHDVVAAQIEIRIAGIDRAALCVHIGLTDQVCHSNHAIVGAFVSRIVVPHE